MFEIISPSFQIQKRETGLEILRAIEKAGRTCYKSEDRITDNSCTLFVASIIKRGHESVLEHASVSVKVICDRGVSHEIVRHRIASYSQESTRYVNYQKKGIQFIMPCFWTEDSNEFDLWKCAMAMSAKCYTTLLTAGVKPEEARSVLPNSLKTEIIMTMNLREWRHFFRLRCSGKAHPQMREISIPLLKTMQAYIPIVFDDIKEEE